MVPLNHSDATYLCGTTQRLSSAMPCIATLMLDSRLKATSTFTKAAPTPRENNERGREEVSNPRSNEEILFQRVFNYV